ncbi:CRISPR-associated endoribonuclease Cas2 3 [Compostibacillus humi]|uniref:CRISPR-associated endoribonuclease Cas2 n=1 Tax=Compostibacillus humi TaxID=1245525 RepID=A0A8J2TTI0_9BACI|nr:CRISPR-associated endoribonuclease Cas2 3 [Compostibacillus humi]
MLVTYDVQTLNSSGQKRLRKVAKKCEEYGVRVQNSVFECVVDNTQLRQLELSLESIIDPQVDSLRFYRLGNNHETKVKHVGAKPTIDVENTLIF